MKENIVRDKSYKFALRVIKLYKYLVQNKKEYVLSKQVLRSGTSIGANYRRGHRWLFGKRFYSQIIIGL